MTFIVLCISSIVYTYQINQIKYDTDAKIAMITENCLDTEEKIKVLDKQLYNTACEIKTKKENMHYIHNEASRAERNSIDVIITAYDLSVQSCGKYPSDPAYGITATGADLSGHTLHSARAIAVDPNVIPLGSKVRIRFYDESLSYLNGIYRAVDTGGAIKGNRVDLFFGDTQSVEPSREALSFGRREAKLTIL